MILIWQPPVFSSIKVSFHSPHPPPPPTHTHTYTHTPPPKKKSSVCFDDLSTCTSYYLPTFCLRLLQIEVAVMRVNMEVELSDCIVCTGHLRWCGQLDVQTNKKLIRKNISPYHPFFFPTGLFWLFVVLSQFRRNLQFDSVNMSYTSRLPQRHIFKPVVSSFFIITFAHLWCDFME